MQNNKPKLTFEKSKFSNYVYNNQFKSFTVCENENTDHVY